MNHRLLKPLAGTFLALCAGLASATPVTDITFNSLQESFATVLSPTYTEQGFTFSAPHLGAWGPVFDADHSPTSGTLTDLAGLNNKLTVTKNSPGTFDLQSLSVADLLNVGIGSTLTITYTDAHGTHHETKAIDWNRGLQTINLNLDDITSFSLSDALGFQLDNVKLQPNALAVPEAGSLALMLAGLGMLGVVARRRKA